MKTQLKTFVQSFLNNDYTNNYLDSYQYDDSCITIHNEKTVIRNKKGDIYVQLLGNEMLTIDLLNCFPNINAVKKSSVIFINGYEWDGKKINIDLFIN